MNFELTPELIITVVGIFTGAAIIFGIYKLATASLHEKTVFKPGTTSHDNRQTVKAIVAIFMTILVFLALYVTWQIFTHQ